MSGTRRRLNNGHSRRYARDGAGVIARRTYLPLGVELLAAADPRGAPTWLRIDRATRMHTSPESGGPRLLMVTERRRRIADFAVVNFGDLEPTKLRLAFSLPHPSFRVHSVAVCVVELAAWSAEEYLPKARCSAGPGAYPLERPAAATRVRVSTTLWPSPERNG